MGVAVLSLAAIAAELLNGQSFASGSSDVIFMQVAQYGLGWKN